MILSNSSYLPTLCYDGGMGDVFAETRFEENALERLKRQSDTYIDVTRSNATDCGYIFPPEILARESRRYFDSRRYTPDAKGLLAAREAICDYYRERARESGKSTNVTPEHVVITASTSEAYSLLFSLLTNPGDTLLGPQITYPLFEYLAAIHRLNLETYPLAMRGNVWTVDDEGFQRTPQARALLLVSPHNPTGWVHADPSPAIAARRTPVICDEVFASFPMKRSHVPCVRDFYSHQPVFVLNGVSKMFALPDLKLGWILMNDCALERYGQRLELLNDTYLSANQLTQFLLPSIFREGANFSKSMRQDVFQKMEETLATLSAHPRIRCATPDGGLFLFPEILGEKDDEEFALRCLRAGVLVHPGYFYDCVRATHVLISLLTPRNALHKGIKCLLENLS
jgi:aspartate/methionine/tyrosine aminotransferase